MTAFQELMNKGRHPVMIFWDALCYYEVRVTMEKCDKMFYAQCTIVDGVIKQIKVSQRVEMYCEYVVRGLAEPLPPKGKNEGRQTDDPPPQA